MDDTAVVSVTVSTEANSLPSVILELFSSISAFTAWISSVRPFSFSVRSSTPTALRIRSRKIGCWYFFLLLAKMIRKKKRPTAGAAVLLLELGQLLASLAVLAEQRLQLRVHVVLARLDAFQTLLDVGAEPLQLRLRRGHGVGHVGAVHRQLFQSGPPVLRICAVS